jgi:hypothetical protein
MLKLPDWAGTLVIVLLLAGFPVTLIFAWIHHLAAEEGAGARASTGKLDWVLGGGLATVIAMFAYQQLAPVPGARTAQQESVAPAPSRTGTISIALLPLANLSGDASQRLLSPTA